MSRFILDTNVVSELAPEKGSAGPNLVDWLNKAENSLFLSVVTLIEVRSGVLKMERLSPGRRQQAIAAWADELDLYFAGRLLPITRDVAEQGCSDRGPEPSSRAAARLA